MSYKITTNDTAVLKGKAKTNIAYTERKRIKITSCGPLATKGGAHGPIRTPYLETIANIKKLLSRDRANVIEVLEDGSEVKLTLTNFCLDNRPVKVEAPKKVEEPKSGEKVQEPAQEKVEEVKPANEYSKKNKNKYNKYNQNNVASETNDTTEA